MKIAFPLTFEKVSIIVNYNYRPFRDHHWVSFGFSLYYVLKCGTLQDPN